MSEDATGGRKGREREREGRAVTVSSPFLQARLRRTRSRTKERTDETGGHDDEDTSDSQLEVSVLIGSREAVSGKQTEAKEREGQLGTV